MVSINEIAKISKKAIDGTKKIEETLSDMRGVSVAGANAGFAAKPKPIKSGTSFVDNLIYTVIFLIYGAVLLFNLIRVIDVTNWTIKVVAEFVYFPEIFVWGAVFLLLFFIPMEVLGVKKGKFEFLESVGKILLFCFVLSFCFGYFLNSDNSPINEENVGEAAATKSFSVFDQNSCYMKDYSACKEKVENTETAKQSDNTHYNIKFEKPVISNFKDFEDYRDDGLRVQFDIESSGDLILKEFRCYHTSKKEENLFYTEELGFEIDDKNSGLKSYYCKDFKKSMFKNKTGDLKLKIYAVLIFDLKSTLTQQVPVLNSGKMSESEIDDEKKDFVKDYTDFLDTGSKLDIKSETFKKQMPVILGDSENTDRSFTIVIRKKVSSFGKFITGEVLDIRVPSSLVLTKEKAKYLGKIDLYDEVHGIDLDVEDNEEFAQSMNQKKIVQGFEVDYISTFENSGTIELKVKVPEVAKDVEGNVVVEDTTNTIDDPNREVSGIGPGIIG
jgi:hypothetical protein